MNTRYPWVEFVKFIKIKPESVNSIIEYFFFFTVFENKNPRPETDTMPINADKKFWLPKKLKAAGGGLDQFTGSRLKVCKNPYIMAINAVTYKVFINLFEKFLSDKKTNVMKKIDKKK